MAAICSVELVASASTGDPSAVEGVLAAIRPPVLQFLKSRLRSYPAGREVAEDTTQDVCMAVVAGLPKYEPRTSFEAFVFRIARNKLADVQRRGYRHPDEWIAGVGPMEDTLDPTPGPEQQAMAAHDLAVVEAALALMPERMAGVLRLRGEGMGTDEIAEQYGMTRNAVRVAQCRALAVLREHLAA